MLGYKLNKIFETIDDKFSTYDIIVNSTTTGTGNKLHIIKIYRVCYLTMFCDINIANNTKIGVISDINYRPKNFHSWANNYIIYIDDNNYRHNININFSNGEIVFKNPDNTTCWGMFTSVYISNT